jgi:hypothetical protein
MAAKMEGHFSHPVLAVADCSSYWQKGVEGGIF